MPPNIKTLYSLYVHIRKSGLPEKKQYNLIRALMAGEEWSWRVTGISVAALARFKDNDFKKTKGIHRDHVQPFAQTAKPMLETIMPESGWCKWIYDNENVRLVTKEENYTNQFSRIIKIDYDLGYFRNNQTVGYRYRRKVEGELLRGLSNKECVTQLRKRHEKI